MDSLDPFHEHPPPETRDASACAASGIIVAVHLVERSQWRRVILGAVAVAVLVLSGAAAAASHRTVPRSGAKAVAQAINLRPGDLPAMTARTISVAQLQSARHDVTVCAGFPFSNSLLAAAASLFTTSKSGRVVADIQSSVLIRPTAALVAADFAAIARPRALSCLVAASLAQYRHVLPKGVTATGSAVRLLPGVSGADTASAIRLTIIVHYSTTSATAALFADYVNFGYGQAEVQLVFGNRSPPSSTLESRLEALLVARARAVIG